MTPRPWLAVLALLIGSPLTTNAQETDAEKAHRLWQETIAYRKSLKSGRVEATLIKHKSPHGEQYEQHGYEVTTTYHNEKTKSITREYRLSNGESKTYYGIYDGKGFIDGGLVEAPIRVDSKVVQPARWFLPRPEFAGFVLNTYKSTGYCEPNEDVLDESNPLLYNYELASLGHRNDAGVNIVTCYYTHKTEPNAKTATYEYAVDYGPSLIRLAKKHKINAEKEFEAEVVSVIRQWPGGFYPESIRYTARRNSQLYEDETATITDARFGITVPAQEFTLAGLSLPPGREVEVGDMVKVWDGSRLTNASPGAVTAVRMEVNRWEGLWPYFLATAIAVVCGAAVLIWRSRSAG